MKIDLKKIVIATALVSLLPMAPMAMAAAKHKAPSKEAVEACKDKKAGDEVEYTTAKGNKVMATCKEVKGQLVAVVAKKKKAPAAAK